MLGTQDYLLWQTSRELLSGRIIKIYEFDNDLNGRGVMTLTVNVGLWLIYTVTVH